MQYSNATSIFATQLVSHPTPTAETQLLVKKLNDSVNKLFQGKLIKAFSSIAFAFSPHFIFKEVKTHEVKTHVFELNIHSLLCLNLTVCANICDLLKPESRDDSDFTVQQTIKNMCVGTLHIIHITLKIHIYSI